MYVMYGFSGDILNLAKLARAIRAAEKFPLSV